MASLALLFGCSPAPPPGQQPDDVVPTPGGPAYRANVHQQGVKDFWPQIVISDVILWDNITASYRADIETAPGTTRNNIVLVTESGVPSPQLTVSVSNVPTGFSVIDAGGGSGRPGTSDRELVITISKDVKPGQYTFQIGINIDGKDFGQIPCTVKVS